VAWRYDALTRARARARTVRRTRYPGREYDVRERMLSDAGRVGAHQQSSPPPRPVTVVTVSLAARATAANITVLGSRAKGTRISIWTCTPFVRSPGGGRVHKYVTVLCVRVIQRIDGTAHATTSISGVFGIVRALSSVDKIHRGGQRSRSRFLVFWRQYIDQETVQLNVKYAANLRQ